MAYVLTRAGAQLLRRHGISVRWRSDDWELGQLEHALGITDFLVAATVACRNSAFLDLVPFHELLASAPAQTQGSRIPDQWRVDVHWRGTKETLHLRPDLIFAVRHRQLAQEGKPASKYFFFEKDTGSMPVVRPSLAQTSVLRKLLSYGATFRGEIHKSRFGTGNMRLLFLTENAQRVAHIIEAYQKHATHAAPASVFLFTDQARLAAAPSFLKSVWLDGEGKEQTLFG